MAAYSASSQAGESGRAATLSRLASLRARRALSCGPLRGRSRAGRKAARPGGRLGVGGSGGRAPGEGAAEAGAAVGAASPACSPKALLSCVGVMYGSHSLLARRARARCRAAPFAKANPTL